MERVLHGDDANEREAATPDTESRFKAIAAEMGIAVALRIVDALQRRGVDTATTECAEDARDAEHDKGSVEEY